MVQWLGWTCNLSNVCSAAVSEVKAEVGRMVLGAGVETTAMNWGPVQEHHELEVRSTEESVQMCLQPFCVWADSWQRGIAKDKCWCMAGETDKQGHSCILIAELKPQFAWIRIVTQVWGNADRWHDTIYEVFFNCKDVSLHCVWSTLDGSEC